MNVHPAKHEVRFVHQKKVHGTVANTVADALAETQRTRWYGSNRQNPQIPSLSKLAENKSKFDNQSHQQADVVITSNPNQNVSESSEQLHNSMIAAHSKERLSGEDFKKESSAVQQNLPDSNSFSHKISTAPTPPVRAVQKPIWEKHTFSDLRFIGQFRGTYLICEGEDGLVLIDQHAAHERITYEKLKKSIYAKKQFSQRLLLPETIELGFREAQILTEMIPDFKKLGLEIEPFGGTTFVVTAVPEPLANRQVGPLIEELVEKIADTGVGNGLDNILDQSPAWSPDLSGYPTEIIHIEVFFECMNI